jgi:hypothetical protein
MDHLVQRRNGIWYLVSVLVFCLVAPSFPQTTTLVDFGASRAATKFGMAGWNTLLLSPNMAYSSAGPDGVMLQSAFDEFTDNMGVSGSARTFTPGERVVVTWYNTSDQSFVFSSRISFNDADRPSGGSSEGSWFTMRGFDDYRLTYQTIAPGSTAKTVFNIESAGVHKSDGLHTLVNINLHIEWFEAWPKQYILCDKIELMSDADITPPAAPGGVVAHTLSDSKIQLQWQPPADNVAAVEYLIYLNGEVEGYSREPLYTAVFLTAGTPYTFTVTALDRARNESQPSAPVTCTTAPYAQSPALLHPDGLVYQGAFRLPDEFTWGGEALAYYPAGDGGQDGSGAADGYPGALFVTDVNQREHGFVGQVSIPAPVISGQKNWEALPVAQVQQQPADIRPANVNGWGDYIDIWRTGLTFQQNENRLYSVWSVHYTVTGEKHACLSCCNAATLSSGAKSGAWHIGDPAQLPIDAMMGDYLFTAPDAWAAAVTSGKSLITGRCRDGGLSGLGPTLYAVAPVGSVPPAPNTVRPVTTLLEYGPVTASDYHHFPQSIDGYLLSDAWRDAAWLKAGSQHGVIIAGNKARGDNWYGYMGERMPHDWVIADIPYPEFYETDPDGKGWKAHNFIPMAILFDPGQLEQVARGTLASWQPQPYAALRFDPELFWSAEREIRSMSFDERNGHLYMLEFDRAREGALIVHVWDVQEVQTGVEQADDQIPAEAFLLGNYPNPFNASTRIRFHLAAAGMVTADLYDLKGEMIGRLKHEFLAAGWHDLALNLPPLSSGVYLLSLHTGDQRAVQKLTLVK